MQPRPGRDFNPNEAFRAFDEALDRFTVKPTHKDGKNFVLVQSLVDWLRGLWPDHPTITQAERLHKAVYHHSQNTFEFISADQLSAEQNPCLEVFSILLTLRKGRLIDDFQRRGIVDRRLPITRSQLQNDIKAMGLSEEDIRELVTGFYAKQWMFCPVSFFRDMRGDYEKDYILPICQKQNINEKGGSATGIYLIEVQEEFVSENLKKGAERYNNKKDKFGFRYQFALKTFHKNNSDLFTNEIKAFRALQGHDGMVKYLGHYTHDVFDPTSTEHSNSTSNILLEYGDLDLDEYFLERLPPVYPAEILRFWKDLFEVGDAIRGVHNVEYGKGEFKEEFNGLHADIKPDNILSVHGKFKLADPGFAHFVKKTEGIPMGEILGGTETYGAPECHPSRRRSSFTVHQTIDIWSLGCVFSIAATWVALGYQGILQYAEFRKNAVKNIRSQNSSSSGAETSSESGQSNDCFHDGHVVLPVVTAWNKQLCLILRKTDTTTALVLDLVDKNMLQGNPKERLSAKEICDELKKIVSKSEVAQAELGEVVPEMIMEGLRQLDDSAPAKVPSKTHSKKASPDSHSRNAKSKRLEVPLMKTAHRSEVFRPAPPRVVAPPTSIDEDDDPETQEGMNRRLLRDSGVHGFSPASSPPAPHVPSGNRPYSIASSRYDETPPQKSPDPSMFSIATKPPIPASMNVYEARQLLAQQKKGFKGRTLKVFGKVKKDVVLSKYFDDRDIIFLVDNGATMRSYWAEAIILLETLVEMAAEQDEDGVDLQFALGSHIIEGGRKAAAFGKAMNHRNAIPGTDVTDIRKPLGKIFEAYLQLVEKARSPWTSKLKKLTIIVLTDGLWEGVHEKAQVNEQIVTFLRQVKERTSINVIPRRVSIEFIQFGKNPDATSRLNDLDNYLKTRGIEDVIDTEPSDGNVYKMLLGSFEEIFDGDEATASPRMGHGESPQDYLGNELSPAPSPSQGLPFRAPTRTGTEASQQKMTSNFNQPGQSEVYSTPTGSLRRNRSHRYSPNSG